jgi:predicted  nucleic acid-binding Zn-ribbon protein
VTVRADPQDQARLLDLQALDTRTQQIAHAKRTLPQTAELAQIASALDTLRRRTAGESGTLDDLRTELRRIESDVAVVTTRLARDSARLQSTASSKDAQGLEHEIASLNRRQSDLEDMQLGVMERVEEQEAVLAGLETERTVLADRQAALTADRDAAVATLDAEEADVVARRAALVATLPEDLVALYEKQRSRYGIGAALLRRGVSGGSNVALTGSDLATIRSTPADVVVLDPESGCILVRTEESGL